MRFLTLKGLFVSALKLQNLTNEEVNTPNFGMSKTNTIHCFKLSLLYQ